MAGIRVTPLTEMMKSEASLRVSQLAVQELANYLEDYAVKLTKVAEQMAEASGRKTISQEDIQKAIQVTALILDK